MSEVFDFLYPTDELVNAIGRPEADRIVRVLMTCLVKGHFTLSSRAESNFKFVLDDFIWRFGRDDFFRIFWSFAVSVLKGLKKEDWVAGIPVGGERIANELITASDDSTNGFVLFDDVMTSGKSLYEYLRLNVLNIKGSKYKGGIVIIDRLPNRNENFKKKYNIFSMVNIKY